MLMHGYSISAKNYEYVILWYYCTYGECLSLWGIISAKDGERWRKIGNVCPSAAVGECFDLEENLKNRGYRLSVGKLGCSIRTTEPGRTT